MFVCFFFCFPFRITMINSVTICFFAFLFITFIILKQIYKINKSYPLIIMIYKNEQCDFFVKFLYSCPLFLLHKKKIKMNKKILHWFKQPTLWYVTQPLCFSSSRTEWQSKIYLGRPSWAMWTDTTLSLSRNTYLYINNTIFFFSWVWHTYFFYVPWTFKLWATMALHNFLSLLNLSNI